MRPHAADHISREDQLAFKTIRLSLAALPEIDLGVDHRQRKIELSCHMLARAVAKVFNLNCVDGKFLGTFDHSWTVTRAGNILDVYPIASLGGPIMWDGQARIITSRMYIGMSEADALEYYGWRDVSEFHPNVHKVTIELSEVANKLGLAAT